MNVDVTPVPVSVGSSLISAIVRVYVYRAEVVPSVIEISQSWSPTRASVISDASADRLPVMSFAPPSPTVIQSGQLAPSENVASSLSSSVAVKVILTAAPWFTLPAVTDPAPSLLNTGASLTSVRVITKVSVTASPVPSDVLQVIENVLSEPLSASSRLAAAPVPDSVVVPSPLSD